jgi:hypothetical protein
MKPIQDTEPFILVEGPKWTDAEFYGNWLLMASRSRTLWEKALECPSFEKQMELMTAVYIPNFEKSAFLFLFKLKQNLVSFTIPLHNSEDWAELDQFTLMAELGFFVLTNGRYQMVTPAKLNMDVVKSAALRFAKTEDEDGLHPEYLVATMPCARAEEWQTRLRDMGEEQRCADRAVLLAKHMNKGKSAAVADSIGPHF